MSLITAADLRDIAGLNTDALVGWETQVASGWLKIGRVWPEHFKGKRVRDFEHGSRLARHWMAQRKGVGSARRSIRAQELRETGGTTIMRACTRADLRAEQIETLREVVRIYGKMAE